MIDITYELDEESLINVRDGIRRSPTVFYNNFQKGVVPDINRFTSFLLMKKPGPVSLPFAFATARSRRAYFATDGFGAGIPYRRTGAHSSAWSVETVGDESDFALNLNNEEPGAEYIFGPRQVPGHANTGWIEVDVVAIKVADYALERTSQLWLRTVEEEAFGGLES